MIRPGIYTEEVQVNRPMNLLGVGLADTIPTDAAQVILQGRLHLHGAAEVNISHVTVRQGGVEVLLGCGMGMAVNFTCGTVISTTAGLG